MIYCKKCKYFFKDQSCTEYCEAPRNQETNINYLGILHRNLKEPKERNKNNDCKDYKKKNKWFL